MLALKITTFWKHEGSGSRVEREVRRIAVHYYFSNLFILSTFKNSFFFLPFFKPFIDIAICHMNLKITVKLNRVMQSHSSKASVNQEETTAFAWLVTVIKSQSFYRLYKTVTIAISFEGIGDWAIASIT